MCIRDSSWLERTPDKGEVRGSNPRRPISQRYFAREERAQGRDPQRDSTWHSAGGISSDGRAPPCKGGALPSELIPPAECQVLSRCGSLPVSYTHLRAHETKANLVCRLLLEKK